MIDQALLEERKTGKTLAQLGEERGVTKQAIHQRTGRIRPRILPILFEVHEYIALNNKINRYVSYEDIARRFPSPSTGEPRSTSHVSKWLERMEELKLIAPRTKGGRNVLRALPLPKRIRTVREDK